MTALDIITVAVLGNWDSLVKGINALIIVIIISENGWVKLHSVLIAFEFFVYHWVIENNRGIFKTRRFTLKNILSLVRSHGLRFLWLIVRARVWKMLCVPFFDTSETLTDRSDTLCEWSVCLSLIVYLYQRNLIWLSLKRFLRYWRETSFLLKVR